MTFYTLTLESNDTSLITHILPCESDIIPLGDISFADLSVPDNAVQIIAQVYAETGVIIESITVEEITEGRRITIVLSCDTLIVNTETGLYDFTNKSSEDLIVCEQCLSVRSDVLIASITTTEGALESEFTPGDTNSITNAAYLIYLSFGKTAYIRYSDGQLCVSTLDEDFSFVSVSTEGGDILFSEKICTEPPNNCDSITASLDVVLHESPNIYSAAVQIDGCTGDALFNWEIDSGSGVIDATDNIATITVNEHVRIHVTASCDGCEFEFFRDLYSEQASPCPRLINCDNKEAIDVFRTLLYKDADNCPVIKIELTVNPVSCLDKCGDISVGETYMDAMKLAVVSDLVLAAVPSGTAFPLDCGDVLPATGNAFLSKDMITGCVAVNVINRGTDASGCSHDCDDHEVILKAISKCGDCYAVNVVEAEQATDVPYIDCSNASLSTETLVRMLLRKVSDNVYAFAVKIT